MFLQIIIKMKSIIQNSTYTSTLFCREVTQFSIYFLQAFHAVAYKKWQISGMKRVYSVNSLKNLTIVQV